MTIGVNLLFIIPSIVGGTETYCRNLIRELVKQRSGEKFVFFLTLEGYGAFKNIIDGNEVVIVKNFRTKLGRIVYEQLVLPIKVRRFAIDILFSPGYVIPVLAKCKHVVTIHDMLYKKYPHTLPLFKRIFWIIFIPLSVKTAKIIITVSEFSQKEILKYFPYTGNKVCVTYEAANYFENRDTILNSDKISQVNIPNYYFLAVSTLSPHKNFNRLLEAISILHHSYNIEFKFVIVGNKERAHRELTNLISNLKIENLVDFTGYLPTRELYILYKNAYAFIMPSLYEGFGLPILEAMSMECPVVCSNIASMPEIAGDAAMYFDPKNAHDIAKSLKTIIERPELRIEMKKKSKKNLQRFSWSVSAKQTLAIFHKIFNDN